jgi:hypothetical protein
MFDGRIIFDGIATVKNFGSWILFPIGSQVKKKSGLKFSVVTCSYRVTCGTGRFSTGCAAAGENPGFGLRISL